VIRLLTVWGLLVALACGPALAADTTTHRYPLPGHGRLALDVPVHWTNELRHPDEAERPSVVFTQPSGARFRVVVTPMLQDIFRLEAPDAETLHQHVEAMAERAGEYATDKHPKLHELKGDSTQGYYFSVAQANPKPGGFKHMTQGIMTVDELVVQFSILTDAGRGEVVDKALAMLRGARHLPPSQKH